MEGKLLSRGPPGQTNAPLLRGAFSNGGDQQHLLPYALGVGLEELGQGGSSGVCLRSEGAAADHPQTKAQGVGGLGRLPVQGGRGAGGSAGAGVVSTAALLAQRFAAAAGLPQASAG